MHCALINRPKTVITEKHSCLSHFEGLSTCQNRQMSVTSNDMYIDCATLTTDKATYDNANMMQWCTNACNASAHLSAALRLN